MTESLLPIGATPLERALEAATTAPIPVPNGDLWNPWLCPVDLLPWLAHSLSVDAWDPLWPEETKREVIAASVMVHRRKGTRTAIRALIRSAGLGEVNIIEGFAAGLYDGATLHDGETNHGAPTTWAEYGITLSRPVTLAQAAQVRAMLARTAPARCRLRSLDYRLAAHLYSGAILNDGTYSHGAA